MPHIYVNRVEVKSIEDEYMKNAYTISKFLCTPIELKKNPIYKRFR